MDFATWLPWLCHDWEPVSLQAADNENIELH
jgi:hypothetical protein